MTEGRRALRRVGIATAIAVAVLVGMTWWIHGHSDKVCAQQRSGWTFSGDRSGCKAWLPVQRAP